MERRPIPHTDLEVSRLCLGTMTFGTPVAEGEAAGLVRRALELGVNFIDTANIYEGYSRYPGSPGGVAEAILGRALAGCRDAVVLATKVGMKVGPSRGDEGLGRDHIRRECDRSLARLATDCIDLYYLHRPDLDVPYEETIDTLSGLIGAGKVRYWGLSNFDADQTRAVLEACDRGGWPRPVAHQPAYSLLRRDIEAELLPLCRRQGIAVVPYRVVEGGLLTGKYSTGAPPPAGSRAADKPDWIPGLGEEGVMAALADLERQAAAAGLSLYAFALRRTLAVPGIASIVVGLRRVEQLVAAVAAVG
ncbi:MAG: aldo/keto reductase [Gemmatimonadota bacterium]